jgi:predicted dehydrogenase
MIRVALVGCGKIADSHVEEIQKLKNARIVGVCDLEPLMAEQLAVRYGIERYYSDFDRMLDDQKPDVVHVTSPPQSHLLLATRAMDAGCHVYVEKPLTLNYRDSKILVDHAVHSKKKLTIGYEYNFDPPARLMRKLLAEGILGEPVHVESCYGYNLFDPAFGAVILKDENHWVHKLPGKLFHNNIDHLLNKIAEFVSDDHPMVRAFSYRRREAIHNETIDALPDELRIMICGRHVSAYGTFSSHARPRGHFLRVYGTKNSLSVDYVSRTVILESCPKLPTAVGRLLASFEQAWQYFREGSRNVVHFAKSEYHLFAGFNFLISAFYDSIINDSPPPVSYRDILWVSAMMDEVFVQLNQPEVRG